MLMVPSSSISLRLPSCKRRFGLLRELFPRLQSGTSVYSRKVEYLRALTYQTLQNFASGRGDAALADAVMSRRGPRGGGRGPGRTVDDWDISDAFFVPWNAVVRHSLCVSTFWWPC